MKSFERLILTAVTFFIFSFVLVDSAPAPPLPAAIGKSYNAGTVAIIVIISSGLWTLRKSRCEGKMPGSRKGR
jgi:hypothetical protein